MFAFAGDRSNHLPGQLLYKLWVLGRSAMGTFQILGFSGCEELLDSQDLVACRSLIS